MELRGHDHVVEVVTFAPIAAYSAIRELAGIPVRLIPSVLAITYQTAEYGPVNTPRVICCIRFARQDNQSMGYTKRAVATELGTQMIS